MKFLKIIPLLALAACNSSGHEAGKKQTETTVEKPVITTTPRTLSAEFKQYWYAGSAEIASYDLQQARYGSMRDGTAVFIFVTEPMDAQTQVKADDVKDTNIPVLKLNATRNFNTGIYPYSIMSSTFLPLHVQANAQKISASIQEWCGHTYMQFNRGNEDYKVMLHSYFQQEGDTTLTLPDVVTENQLPAQLRLGPENMPQGTFEMIPSAEFLRLKHVQTTPVMATATLVTENDTFIYKVHMPDLDRRLSFTTEIAFPYRILKWTDRYRDGADYLETNAVLKKTIQSAYWNKNTNDDEYLRNDLGL